MSDSPKKKRRKNKVNSFFSNHLLANLKEKRKE